MIIDKGVPLRHFADLVESYGDLFDFVKFGWGTSVVTKNFETKLEVLREANIDFYLGGTLFEKYVLQDRFDEFRFLCEAYGCRYVEVSNGTIDITNDEKAEYVKRLSDDLPRHLRGRLEGSGDVRHDGAGQVDQLHPGRPRRRRGPRHPRDSRGRPRRNLPLQRRTALRPDRGDSRLSRSITIGSCSRLPRPSCRPTSFSVSAPNANLGNIAVSDIVPLETIRLGLRSETLLDFEPSDSRRF